jgi:hypothetical protein
MSRKGGEGTELTRRPLVTNTIFVLLLFVKAAILFCKPIILCLLYCITEIIQVPGGSKQFPRGPLAPCRMLVSPDLEG